MYYNKSAVKGYSSIVKAFCLYFKSQFLFNDVEELPNCMYYDAPLFCMPRISSKMVYDELLCLKSTTATGSDDLPAIFLIKCAEVLCVPLSCLFNKSITINNYLCASLMLEIIFLIFWLRIL